MFKDTITLFNRKPGGVRGDTWYPTVIKNANVNIDHAAILSKYGAESQDNAILHIRYENTDGTITVAGKPWKPPKEWSQTNDTLTFASGTKFDFFWLGEWKDGIVEDSDYSGGFYDWMNRTYDYVFAISSVARYSLIPHFEIMGR